MMAWFRRLRARIRYRQFERDLAEELALHRDLKEAALASEGVGADEVRWRARRELGNITLMRENARAVWIAPWLESVWQDVRYALRNLRAHPGFTAAATLTLVLGIGLNASLFTVFNAVALRPWPVRNPRTLMLLHSQPDAQRRFSPVSLEEYTFLSRHTTSFTGLASVLSAGTSLEADDSRRPTGTAFVTTNFFDVVGVGTETGRTFAAGDGASAGAGTVVVISHQLWRNRFGGDPAIIGRTLHIEKRPFTVIGVVERGFTGPEYRIATDLYLPFAAMASVRPNEQPRPGRVIGRLAPGIGRTAAKVELDALAYRFRTASRLEPRGFLVTGTSPVEQPNGPRGLGSLALMQAAMFLVLIIACSNIGNLQLARALGRRREIGIRMSMGASRRRVVRQLVTETLVLSCGAGILALGAAHVLPGPVLRLILGAHVSGPNDPFARLRPDSYVLAFTAALSFLAALVSGLAPALRATKPGPTITAADWHRIGAGRMPVRAILLATQIALSMVLLVGAGLLTVGIARMLSQDLDFTTKGVVVAQMTPGAQSHRADADAFVRSVLDAMQTAGLSPVGIADLTPVRSNSAGMLIRLPGESASVYRQVAHRPASNSYFAVLGIRLVAGRWFDEHASEPREAIVNETFARTVWPGNQALRHSFVDTHSHASYTVVGIVRDCHETGLGDVPPVLHTVAQPGGWSNLLVRGEPGLTAAKIRTIAARVDPGIKMTIVPLGDYVREELAIPIVGAGIAWASGLLGLALAIVGVFGVFAYVVEERKREIGIRIALGARGAEVVRIIIAQTRMATLGGLAAGFVLSVATGRLLRAYLFGASALDPIAYGGIALLLGASAVIATYVPARRASRIDPSVTLRCD